MNEKRERLDNREFYMAQRDRWRDEALRLRRRLATLEAEFADRAERGDA